MQQLKLCRAPRPAGPPPPPRHWYDVLHTPCLCGKQKRPNTAFCDACMRLLKPILIRHLNRARSNRAFMFWWKFSAARLAAQGQTLHIARPQ